MDGEGISDGLPAERKVETRVKKNGRTVIVEKSAAKGLPEGWIKKIIITNRPGRKSRRDPFFIDPKSEYIFQSFKDASRYAETGNLGNYARKLKESDIEDDDDSGNGKNVLLESADDLLQNINSKRRNLSSSDEHSENSKVISDLSTVTSQALEDLGKKEEVNDPIEKQPIAKRVTRSQAKASKNEEDIDLKRKKLSSSNAKSVEGKADSVKSRLRSASSQSPEKKSIVIMKEEEVRDSSTEKRITRSKAIVKKNELTNSVERRASKRLAGIELEPTPELKTRAKSQRIVPLNLDDGTPGKCKQPVNLAATDGLKKTDIPFNEEVAKSCSEHSSPKPDAAAGTSSNSVSAEMEVLIEKICKPGSGDKKMPLDDGTPGKCEQPINLTDGMKKTDIHFNKEVAKSYSEHSSPKPNPVATTSNRVVAELEMQMEKICKPAGRNGSGDEKKMKTPLVWEQNPVFHLDGYKQKEEMSPVSPLSRQTSDTKREKTTSAEAGKRLGRSSPKANRVSSPKATAISPSKGEHPHPFDNGNAIQRRDILSKDSAKSSVVRGTCSEMMEKNTNNNSFSSSSSSSAAFDSTLADLWKDPCIAFAIKTLTGESLRLPDTAAATSSDPDNNHAKQKGVSFVPETPPENPVFTSEDIWKDPCIEFAIKTLTGEIPIELDEPDARLKPSTPAMQEQEGRQSSSSFDNLVQQCTSNMRKNKTVGNSGDPRFTQSFFYKD